MSLHRSWSLLLGEPQTQVFWSSTLSGSRWQFKNLASTQSYPDQESDPGKSFSLSHFFQKCQISQRHTHCSFFTWEVWSPEPTTWACIDPSLPAAPAPQLWWPQQNNKDKHHGWLFRWPCAWQEALQLQERVWLLNKAIWHLYFRKSSSAGQQSQPVQQGETGEQLTTDGLRVWLHEPGGCAQPKMRDGLVASITANENLRVLSFSCITS